jgi:hypothetical protein
MWVSQIDDNIIIMTNVCFEETVVSEVMVMAISGNMVFMPPVGGNRFCFQRMDDKV